MGALPPALSAADAIPVLKVYREVQHDAGLQGAANLQRAEVKIG